MPAFAYEYELAKADGVRFEWFVQPLRIVPGGVEFVRTTVNGTPSRHSALRTIAGSNFLVHADMIVKALGQEPLLELLAALPGLRVERGKVWIDPATGATSIAKLFAGGDCISGGGEIVDAVQDGKIAAWGIDAALKPLAA